MDLALVICGTPGPPTIWASSLPGLPAWISGSTSRVIKGEEPAVKLALVAGLLTAEAAEKEAAAAAKPEGLAVGVTATEALEAKEIYK